MHEGQLVFHTPPYSLQPVSLQEGNESIGKANIRIVRSEFDGIGGGPQRSPMAPHKSASAAAVVDPSLSAAAAALNKTPSGDKIDRNSSYQSKLKATKETAPAAMANSGPVGSPNTLERKARRFSYANSRYNRFHSKSFMWNK